MSTDLQEEIRAALNRASAENASGTPDHILAGFLLEQLELFNRTVRARAEWRGETTQLPALTRTKEQNR